MPCHVVHDLSAAGGMANVDSVLQIEMRRQHSQIIGVVIHVMAVAHLTGAAMSSAIMRYDAKSTP